MKEQWRAAAEIADDMGRVPPFSNGTEGEIWMDKWCYNGCVKDRDVDSGNGCPLLLQALLGETPDEWVPSPDHRYVCTSWSADEPDRSGTDPAQSGLFDEPEHAPSPEPERTRAVIAALTAARPRRRPIITVELPDVREFARR